MQTKDTSKAAPSDLRLLQMPPVERQDLVIVGGGPSGLTAAMRLFQAIEHENEGAQEPAARGARFKDLSKVTLLAGGNSLAFSPVTGEFGAFLTLYASDSARRDKIHEDCRNFVKRKFGEYHFDFKTNSFAKKIEVSSDNRFVITTESENEFPRISTKKLILALGHSLKDRPPALQNHAFKGTNDLCARLQQLLPSTEGREECLDRLLSGFARTNDGTLRIGLIGLGSSFLEAFKIFHALLDPPQYEGDVYRTRLSRTPVEFVLYDDRLGSNDGPIQEMLSRIEKFQSHISDSPEPEALVTAEDVRNYKTAEMHRIKEFVRTNQISVVPERFDWNSTKLVDNKVVASRSNGQSEAFSCLLDCSPFNVGINAEQRNIIAGIPALKFTELSQGTFHTELQDATHRSSLALVGAAFAPKDKWGLGTMNEHGIQAIQALFPRD